MGVDGDQVLLEAIVSKAASISEMWRMEETMNERPKRCRGSLFDLKGLRLFETELTGRVEASHDRLVDEGDDLFDVMAQLDCTIDSWRDD